MIVFSLSKDVFQLFYIMILPLLDGAYFSIILTNQLETIVSSILIGLTVLSGIASISIAQNIKGDKKTKFKKLLKITTIFLIILIITTILAKTISDHLYIQRLKKFAAASIFVLAIKISHKRILPQKIKKILKPTIIIFIGLIFSIQSMPNNLSLILDQELLFHSLIAGFTAISSITIASLVQLPNYKNLLDYLTPTVLIIISLKILGII